MKQFDYADLHCDTPLELFKRKEHIDNNSCHVSLELAEKIDRYIQVGAVWSDKQYTPDECYRRFFETREYFEKELSDRVALCKNYSEIKASLDGGKRAFMLAVEDARLLNGDIARLDELYKSDVRFLTLQWAGETCIGGGHDTSLPLTDFGRKAVSKCFELGIVPDVSHASHEVTAEITDMARMHGKPVVATHSDSYALSAYSRNLTDKEFCDIAAVGGLVGINFCTLFLSLDSIAGIDTVISHIEHYLSLGGENAVCFGADYDGIDDTQHGLENISKVQFIAERMSSLGYKDEIINKIFFTNVCDFIKRNF